MGIPDRTKETAEKIVSLKEQLEKMGVSSAEVGLTGEGEPLVKSFRLDTSTNPVIQNVAQADPANIQQVAASQFALSDSYYKSVLQQAQQSFISALVAAGIGLIFFLVAVSIIFFREPGNISIISLISGALIEVISAINFYLYGRASSQLANFHVPLVRTQRFLLANSVCENLEGQVKQTTRAELVKLMMNPLIDELEEKERKGSRQKKVPEQN